MAEENQDHPEIVGGPGQEATPNPEPPAPSAPAEPPATPAGPALEKVKLAGQEVEVPPEVAEAIRQREQEFNQKLSEQGTELGALRRLVEERLPQQPEAPVTEQPQDVWENVLFEDPAKAKAMLMDDVRKLVADERDAVIQQTTQERARQQFWTQFYANNDDLKGNEDIVEAIFAKNLAALQNLSPLDAADKIAELSRGRILKLMNSTPATSNKPQVEPASPPTTPPAAPEPASGSKSLTDSVKARRRSRRQAAASS